MRGMRVPDVQTPEILKALGEVGKNIYTNFAPHTVGGRHPADDDPTIERVALLCRSRYFSGEPSIIQVR
jgi:hypothetical protein